MNNNKENTPKYEKGDVVRLKSGGPEMTISNPVEGSQGDFRGRYVCQWFSGSKLQGGHFEETSLEKVEKDE